MCLSAKYLLVRDWSTGQSGSCLSLNGLPVSLYWELGNRKPSQFYHHLVNPAGPGVPEEFLRTFWTRRLPNGTQAIIASQSKSPMEDLADLVDCINDVVGMQAPAASTLAIASTSRSSESSEVAVLTKQVAMLTEKIDIMSQKSCRSRNRNRWCQQLKIDEFTLCVYATPTVLVSLKLRRTSCDYQPAGNAKGNH